MNERFVGRLVSTLAVLSLFSGGAQAQGARDNNYPNRPVRFITHNVNAALNPKLTYHAVNDFTANHTAHSGRSHAGRSSVESCKKRQGVRRMD